MIGRTRAGRAVPEEVGLPRCQVRFERGMVAGEVPRSRDLQDFEVQLSFGFWTKKIKTPGRFHSGFFDLALNLASVGSHVRLCIDDTHLDFAETGRGLKTLMQE